MNKKAKISNFEKQYMNILSKIYHSGFSDGINERTGVATKRLPGVTMTIDVEEEFPILHSKKVFGITALREIEWIWKDMSNNVNDLKAKIWDEWADSNGSIGKSYGYQIDQPVCIYINPLNRCAENFRSYENQRDFVRYYLKEFPNGRQCTTTIWNPSQLAQMNLVPCVHTQMWNLDGGRLNLTLCQRSGDFPVGVPFNTTQYAQLMCMFAYELGVKPGILTHTIADAHIYDRQMRGVELQLEYYNLMLETANHLNIDWDSKSWMTGNKDSKAWLNRLDTTMDRIRSEFSDVNEIPSNNMMIERLQASVTCDTKFIINSKNRDMMSYRADSCKLEDYGYIAPISFGDIVV